MRDEQQLGFPWSSYRISEVARVLGVTWSRACTAIQRAGLATRRGRRFRGTRVACGDVGRVRAALFPPPAPAAPREQRNGREVSS
jgi:hypothetical protein